jgi:hypothetical protein
MLVSAADLLRSHSIVTSLKGHRNKLGANELRFAFLYPPYCSVPASLFLVNYNCLYILLYFVHHFSEKMVYYPEEINDVWVIKLYLQCNIIKVYYL